MTNMMIRPRKMKTMMMKRQTCSMAKKVSKIKCENHHFPLGWPILAFDKINPSVLKSKKAKFLVEMVKFCVKGYFVTSGLI